MHKFAGVVLALSLAFAGVEARAGVFTDDLGKCLVKSTNEADQKALVIWIFSVASQHPEARSLANVTAAQQETMSRRTAGLIQRLMTEDCRTETVAALKYEGTSAVETAFGTLGEIAMTSLMSHPDVAKALEGLSKYLDNSKFEALGNDTSKLPRVPPR